MKSYINLKTAALVMICGLFFLQSCRKDDETIITSEPTVAAHEDQAKVKDKESSAILKPWYDLLNNLIKSTPSHTPPISARDIAYTSIALYEATTGGVNGYKSLEKQIQGLNSLPDRLKHKDYIGPVAANAALARIIPQLFANATPANLALITTLEATNDASFTGLYDNDDILRSQQFGRDIADAIYLYSQSDGGNQAYLSVFPPSYVPPVGPGLWVPTSAQLIPMLPYWGSNRTFVAENSLVTINPPAPPAYSTVVNSPFYNYTLQVYNTVNNLTQDQKDIANFWADDGGTYTPPGHLIAIAMQLITEKDLSMHKAAALLAKTGITLNDGGIVCWRTKYNVNLLRPVTYIKANINAGWVTFIATPPFPAYTSGHSTYSGGAATILEKEFGKHKSFTDNTKIALGFPARTYTSFEQAAQEAALSRLYGGIHFEFDNVNGFICGEAVAKNVLKEIHWK